MKEVQEQQQPESMESNESVSGSNEYAYRPLTTKHRRAGSTGTTGDEEYTTDEDELYTDEADCSIGATLHPPHPILKSDLARAATDLFGYVAKREDEDEEPTSLFDDDDNKFLDDSSTKTAPLFAYNEKLQGVLSRHRNPSEEKAAKSCELKSHELEVLESTTQHAKPLDFRLNKVEAAGETSDEKIDTDSTKDDNSHESSKKFSLSKDIKSEVPSKQELLCVPKKISSPPSPTTLQWGRAVAEVKEHAVAKLQEELKRAHEELKLKDEEVARLSRIRQDVEAELEELTASLFQEAHNMVREANVRQATAERLLEESRMKSEVLAAEVVALKTLVLTSTPSRPNPHLHPQIDMKGRLNNGEEAQQGLFMKKHRRSPSHFNLKYGRENSPPDSPVKEQRLPLPIDKEILERDWKREREKEKERECKDFGLEVDPRVHTEFLRWKANPCVDKSDSFVARVFREDIDLCLHFPNKELGAKVRQAVLDGIIFIEAVSDKTKLAFPKKCALLEAARQCHYRMRLGDQENQWHCISQICRNRIIAVCDFLNYLRYVERGLVKSSVHDVYWEITRLRKEMVFARLGLALSS
ncbi:guanine nucleotide exchange factor for Rab-3A [Polyergus mexicanus]|uniref:guanine nucleotide exchange factor for Rab-3A n=1 Tax=Polyergus mexicanus TaxID=615972 RepID=UPI0038B43612